MVRFVIGLSIKTNLQALFTIADMLKLIYQMFFRVKPLAQAHLKKGLLLYNM
jgi:hypothetical protein